MTPSALAVFVRQQLGVADKAVSCLQAFLAFLFASLPVCGSRRSCLQTVYLSPLLDYLNCDHKCPIERFDP